MSQTEALINELFAAAEVSDCSWIIDIIKRAHELDLKPWLMPDEWYLTPLMRACKSNHAAAVDCVRVLAGEDSVRRASKKEGWTPLMLAAEHGTAATVEMLIPLSNLNAVNSLGHCALMRACAHGRLEAARMLMKACPGRLHAVDHDGVDALMRSAWSNVALTRELLEWGANPLKSDKSQCTALMCAVSAGNAEMAAVLIAAGAKPLARAKGGVTPLMKAAGTGSMECVQLLAEYGGLSSVDKDDKSAAQWAQGWGHKNVRLWLEHAIDSKLELKVLRRTLRQAMVPKMSSRPAALRQRL